jgi:hypothetical protein
MDTWGELGVGRRPTPPGTAPPMTATPTRVQTELRFASLHAGTSRTCGLPADGALHCWGLLRDALASPGTGLGVPTPIVGPRLSAFAMQVGFGCGLGAADARPYCYGYLADLAGGTPFVQSETLVRWGPDLPLRSIAVGALGACGLGTDGVAYCWGSNMNGALGAGDFDARREAARVVGQ